MRSVRHISALLLAPAHPISTSDAQHAQQQIPSPSQHHPAPTRELAHPPTCGGSVTDSRLASTRRLPREMGLEVSRSDRMLLVYS